MILSEKIQHFNIAHTSILPRTGIILLFLVVYQILTEKDFRMKYSDSNYGKKHKKSRNLKVVLLLSRTLYSSLSPYLLFHTHYFLRYRTSMISTHPIERLVRFRIWVRRYHGCTVSQNRRVEQSVGRERRIPELKFEISYLQNSFRKIIRERCCIHLQLISFCPNHS